MEVILHPAQSLCYAIIHWDYRTYSSCDDDSVGETKAEGVGYDEVASELMNDEGILHTNTMIVNCLHIFS